ncbi:MAG TPA: hypothetical protein VHK06_05615, partial [Candidatus Limnocylindria bacterium]|nr:hypothetical protein [Candidatus Limnocylindria bacterium]
AGTYTGLTVNAINLWMNPWSGLADAELHWGDDTLPAAVSLFGSELLRFPFTWQHVGLALFVGFALLALWQVARRDDALGLLVAATLLAVAFFVVPTRVHERYLFPALALAAPLALRRPSWGVLYGVLSASLFLNVYYVYTADWSFVRDRVLNPGADGAPMPRDPLLDATVLSPVGVYLLAAAAVAALGWVAWRSLRLGLAGEPRPGVAPPTPAVAMASEVPADAVRHADRADWVPRQAAPAASGPALSLPAWIDRLRPASAVSAARPRRLDRIDVLLIAALVAAALLFRLWRLDQPRGMHFDEVYHARSAVEWLANWQHGWRRDVYEWTHPMLAKYLIAGGIVLADPNRIVDRAPLDAPAPALAVAPRRSSVGHHQSVAFLTGGSEIVARDAASGDELARWHAGGAVAALAYDEEATRLLVGLASSGAVETYDLRAFLASTGPRAPPPRAAPIETELAAVRQIALAPAATVIAFADGDGISVHERATGAPLASAERSVGGLALVPDPEDARLAVTEPASGSVLLLDTGTLEPTDRGTLAVDAEVLGPLVARGEGDDRQLFALTGPLPETAGHPASRGGMAVIDADAEQVVDLVPLPGEARRVAWEPVANIVYVAGTTGDGPVLWAVDPH